MCILRNSSCLKVDILVKGLIYQNKGFLRCLILIYYNKGFIIFKMFDFNYRN